MFIDACLAPSIKSHLSVRLLHHQRPPVVVHSLDIFPEGTLDDRWPPYCKEHRMVPITADGSKSNHGPKLRRIFSELQFPHFVIGAKIKNAGTLTVIESIVATWDRIVDVFAMPESTRYTIAYNDDRSSYRLLKSTP